MNRKYREFYCGADLRQGSSLATSPSVAARDIDDKKVADARYARPACGYASLEGYCGVSSSPFVRIARFMLSEEVQVCARTDSKIKCSNFMVSDTPP